MTRVTFDLVKEGSMVVYPDDLVYFSNVVIIEDKVHADYRGALILEESTYVEPTGIRKISIGSFRRRFTLSEKVAMEASVDPVIKVLDKDLMASTYVDLDYPDTVAGINYLSPEILEPSRVLEILQDGTVEEEYKGV